MESTSFHPSPALFHTYLIDIESSNDNLLARIHLIIVMTRWTGLAPREFGFPYPGSPTSTFLRDLICDAHTSVKGGKNAILGGMFTIDFVSIDNGFHESGTLSVVLFRHLLLPTHKYVHMVKVKVKTVTFEWHLLRDSLCDFLTLRP